MNCKVHPTAEAVTTCAVCGAGICSQCAGIFHTGNDESLCLECALKKEEDKIADCKYVQKDTLIMGGIATVIWGVGVWLAADISPAFILIMLGAAILFGRKALFMSDERDFFEKIKTIFWQIVLGTFLLPVFVILLLITANWKMIKSKSAIRKIKAALNSAN